MNRFYISIASNILPKTNIESAIARLREVATVTSISRCYITQAIAAPNDAPGTQYPQFINCVALIESANNIRDFKYKILQPIENALGRIRTSNKYSPRTIDLDILLFNNDVICADGIEIPDPDILDRWFLQAAILDIDPEAVLPTTLEPLKHRLQELKSRGIPPQHSFIIDDDLRKRLTGAHSSQ